MTEQLSNELADALAITILGQERVADPLALVRRCARAETMVRDLTGQAVDAARRTGASWADIGKELEISRQAAQQRFGGSPTELTSDEERWLGPVTAFDEMGELELAGRLGWHTVEADFLRHRMVRTATQWEHKRITYLQPRKQLLAEGWQVGCTAFPWIYLVRDVGIAAASDH